MCHSSQDKDYVRIVANHLGRAKIIFDEVTFNPGEDFRTEILKGLDSADLFIFFASKRSLESLWCKYEINQAELRIMSGTIQKFLVIIIDNTVTYDNLPRWMQSCKAVIQTRPSQATRDIQHALFSIFPPQAAKPFIGRQPQQQEFVESISDIYSLPKKIFIVSGLENIGRRSFLERVTFDNLGLHLGPFFFIDETRGLDDIYVWALNETAEIGSIKNLSDEMKAFASLPNEKKVEEIVNRFKLMCSNSCLPCLVDQGGMLSDDGKYLNVYADIINRFIALEYDYYLAIIHRRVPKLDCIDGSRVVKQKIPPLDRNETLLLLKQLFRKIGKNPEKTDLEELVQYLDGYPPSVYFSVSFAKEYGLKNLLADKSVLEDFKDKRFSKFITELNLDDTSWKILRYLAAEHFVPLNVICIAVEEDPEIVSPKLRNLIDNNLVIVADENFGISQPIKAAIFRATDLLTVQDYQRIVAQLTKEYWQGDSIAPSIEIVDATLNAVAKSGSSDFNPYADLVRPSIVHKLAKECYHRKEYELGLKYAKRALQMAPENENVKIIYFKTLVQLEKWSDAEKMLNELFDTRVKTAYYLKGFMQKKRRDYKSAIESFELALKIGDTSYSVYRDYADCLFRVGKYKKALDTIKYVLDRDSENIYVLDLVVRIYLEENEIGAASEYLEKLERFDHDKRFIHHRRASYWCSLKRYDLALIEADRACSTKFSPFEAFAQKIDILIELNKFDEAEAAIREISHRFGQQRKDIQLGLNCKLHLRKNDWKTALEIWSSIENKEDTVHLALLCKIYEIKANDFSVPLTERRSASEEVFRLKEVLREVNEVNFGYQLEDQFDGDEM